MTVQPNFDAAATLPIQAIIPEIQRTLEQQTRLIIQAPPGAGKSTMVPLALLNSPWLEDRQIWLLEPRRLAAQQVAQRMADTLGEPLGQTVGIITGQQSKMSKNTKLVVMTEAILTNKLLNDEEIPECAAILFDEFHERNLHSDLGLALSYECQQLLRDDLRLVVMSATLAMEQLQEALEAKTVTSEGRSFPVDIHYLGTATSQHIQLEQHVVKAVSKALNEEQGHILVFLPGMKEIRRTQSLLEDLNLGSNATVLPLHGQLPAKEQQAALRPMKEGRKVVLATSVAETSLTIDGVRVVIDSGIERSAQFNIKTGMDQLISQPASQASAEQRKGRAGRQQDGVCYRLWSQDSHSSRDALSAPDVLTMDLTGFALTLASWGSLTLQDYLLLDQPNLNRWQEALALLQQLGALTEQLSITTHGRQLATLGVHPRLAHMLLLAKERDMGWTACQLAAMLSEGNPLRFEHPHSDLRDAMELLNDAESGSIPKRYRHGQVNVARCQRIQQQARKLKSQLKISSANSDADDTGLLLMLAYPDRIAQGRGKGFRLRNGLGVQCLEQDTLQVQKWLAIADISASQGKQSWVQQAAPISEQEIREYLDDQITEQVRVDLSDKGAIKGFRQEVLGQLVLKETPFKPSPEDIQQGLLNHVKQNGLSVLNWTEDCQTFLARLSWAHKLETQHYPASDEAALLATLDEWLLPFLNSNKLADIDLLNALKTRITWDQQTQFDKDYPERVELPSGRQANIDYGQDVPLVSCKLQECFGLTQSPTIAGGKQKVQLSLLSPAQKPLALTLDLPHFWQNVYPEVRKEMRGRYPKHPWPDNPLEHQATAKTKRHLS